MAQKSLEELLSEFKKLQPVAPGMAPNQLMTPEEQEDIEFNKLLDSMPELRKIRGTAGNLGESDPATQEREGPPGDMSSVAPIDYKKDQEGEVTQKPDIMFGKNDVSTLEALKAAQKARNFNLLGSDIARAGAMIGSAITGIENKGLKELAESTEKRADIPLKDFAQQVEIQKKDPNSAVSRGYKELLERKMGIKLGGDVSAADIEPFLTAQMKKSIEKQVMFQKGGVDEQGNLLVFDPKTGEYKATGTKAQDQLFQVRDPKTGAVQLMSRRAGAGDSSNVKATIGGAEPIKEGEEFTRKNLDPVQRKALDEETKRLDTLTKGANEQMAGIRKVRSLLSSGSKLTPAAIRTQMPRVMGEVGNMSEQEQAIWTGSQDLLSRAEQYLSTITTSELTPENKAEFQKLLNAFEKSAINNLDIITGGSAAQMQELYGVPQTFSKRVLLPAQIRQSKISSSTEIKRKTQDGRTAVFDAQTKKFIRYED